MSQTQTETSAAFTCAEGSADAGQDLGNQVRDAFGGGRPDAVIVHASGRFDHEVFLRSLDETCHPRVLVGASSAGEFTGERRGTGSACALAIRSGSIRFNASLGTAIGTDSAAAARQVVAGFTPRRSDLPHRAAVVFTDALAGHTDHLIEELTLATSGGYEFAGGGAGDDAKFAETRVFLGTRAVSDAVVALEVLSPRPLGIGVHHGWVPASSAMRVTDVRGKRLIGLDGYPAIEALERHADRTGQYLDRQKPLAFFLHNIIGIDAPGGHRLRVPLAIDDGGGVLCAAEIPAGARVHFMKSTADSACEAAANATRAAVAALGTGRPAGALFFDCVATRLRNGDQFGYELDAVKRALGGVDLVGCNTYGQIARAAGQFSGFHNCTAVVFALPQ